MKKLKLPIVRNSPENHKWLSMDEYIKFVNFNFKYFRKKNNTKSGEADTRVDVPFSIK